MLRNYAGGNGYVQQLVTAGTIDFGIGAIGTSADNVIEDNVVTGNANGIVLGSNARGNIVRRNMAIGNPALQDSSSFTATTCASPPCNGSDIRNVAPAGTNTIVDNHCITLISSVSLSTPPCRIFLPAADATPLATGLVVDPSSVPVKGAFTSTFSGNNLTSGTYFDIRVRAPSANADVVVLNWQQGLAARHAIPVGTAIGDWRVTGVRAHQDMNEHSGSFALVQATLSVFVLPFGF